MNKLKCMWVALGISLVATSSFAAGLPITIDRFTDNNYLNEGATNYALGTAVSDALVRKFPEESYMFKVVSGGGLVKDNTCVYSVVLAVERKSDGHIEDLQNSYGYVPQSDVKKCRAEFAQTLHDEGVSLSKKYH